MHFNVVFFMICIIFSPGELFNVHFLSFTFVPIRSLVFILEFISDLIFCSSLLLLHFTFFPLLIFILKFIFLCCFIPHSYYFSPYSLLKPFSSHQSSYILFPILKIPLFSLHLYQSLLIGCGYSGCCCIPSILFLDLHYFYISNLKFYHSAHLVHFLFLLPFLFFFVLNFNFSLTYPDFHFSLLIFLQPLSS